MTKRSPPTKMFPRSYSPRGYRHKSWQSTVERRRTCGKWPPKMFAVSSQVNCCRYSSHSVKERGSNGALRSQCSPRTEPAVGDARLQRRRYDQSSLIPKAVRRLLGRLFSCEGNYRFFEARILANWIPNGIASQLRGAQFATSRRVVDQRLDCFERESASPKWA